MPHMSLNYPVASSPPATSPQPSLIPDCNNDQSEMLVIKGRVKEQVKLFGQQATSQTSSLSHSPCLQQDGRNNTTQQPPLVNGSRKLCPAVAKKPVRNPFACPLPLCKCDSCEEADKPIQADQQNRFYPVNPNFYVQLNDHIVVRGDRTGYIRYIGHLNKIGPPNTVFIGLELDAPVGVNKGCFDGKQYFECPKEHGLFVMFSDVVCLVKKPFKQHSPNNLKHKKAEPSEDRSSESSFTLVPTRKPVLSSTTVSDDETLEPASMTDSASSDQISSTDSQSTSPDPIVWKNYYHHTHDQLCHRQAILRKSVHL